MCKKQKRCLEMERLPRDVVERIMQRLLARTLLKYKCVSKQWKSIIESRLFQEKHVQELIMERLPVKSLVRFKCVSKQWKWTIESRLFQERQLAHRQQSAYPDVLLVSAELTKGSDTKVLATLTLGSPSSAVEIPTPWSSSSIEYLASNNSCDGLVCLYDPHKSGFVVNPTTRWFHPLPLSRLQQLTVDLGDAYFKLGFGKDIVRGTYKPVWLYNSSEVGLENATTCEVFDFTTNAWRYVTPSCPYRIISLPNPVFAYGSLHWFTDCEEETKIVSFDLHTEAFQVLCKAPFTKADDPANIVMCNLNNHLCVSLKDSRKQVIWSFHSPNKTWGKMWSISLYWIHEFCAIPTTCALSPLVILDAKDDKESYDYDDYDYTECSSSNLDYGCHGDDDDAPVDEKMLYFDRCDRRGLVIEELRFTVFEPVFLAQSIGHPICYFPSLISI